MGKKNRGNGDTTGSGAFEAQYRALYGERWPGLREALLGAADSRAYETGLLSPYFMDSASIEAASALVLPENGEILDACAAPGGKSLVVASRMGPGATLLCNELSPDRSRRLVAVLDAHLPQATRERVRACQGDAAGMCRANESRFAAILLDAPCSSERHVLADASALDAWKPSRVRSLASRQWALLSSCFLMLAPGGMLVYSTCALSPDENEGVAERLFKKYKGRFEPVPVLPSGEDREFGRIVLPDRSGGAGPMYAFGIQKSG